MSLLDNLTKSIASANSLKSYYSENKPTKAMFVDIVSRLKEIRLEVQLWIGTEVDPADVQCAFKAILIKMDEGALDNPLTHSEIIHEIKNVLDCDADAIKEHYYDMLMDFIVENMMSMNENDDYVFSTVNS